MTKRPALDHAAEYLEKSERSVAEVVRHLTAGGFDENAVNEAVQKLTELRYLDDSRLADRIVELGIRRLQGRERLRLKLAQRGIIEAVAEAALASYSEQLEARAAAAVIGDEKPSPKLLRKLVARGFSEAAVQAIIEQVTDRDFAGGEPGNL